MGDLDRSDIKRIVYKLFFFLYIRYTRDMIPQELVEHVKQALTQGISQDTLVSQMRASGWNEQDIQEVFTQVSLSAPVLNIPASQAGEPAFYKKKKVMTIFIIIHLALILLSFLLSPILQNSFKSLFSEVSIKKVHASGKGNSPIPCIGFYDSSRNVCVDPDGTEYAYPVSVNQTRENKPAFIFLSFANFFLLLFSSIFLFLFASVYRGKKYISITQYIGILCLFFATVFFYVYVLFHINLTVGQG